MKLLTTIPPRTDGTVKARIPGVEAPYIFEGDPLVCDVADKAHIKHLLGTKQFIPADQADFKTASEALQPNDEQPDPGYEIKTVEVGDTDPETPKDFDVEAADEPALRAFIKSKTGKNAPSAAGIDRLRAIAETVAD